MLITLPFFAFASLNSMPYIQHAEKEFEVNAASYVQETTGIFDKGYREEQDGDYQRYNMDVSV